ncbi:UvrD-helicase domain-containing protein [Flavobacteriales bacterium]|jgi:ATP-dependent exoDNAse (exonuclease V) beta subunit|nr:UvrD-helicase domain-containing protein [Flavobacteriales bacterium]
MKKNLQIYRSSAGSGKTYTLVRNYIRIALLGDGKDFFPRYFRHILAITFTNKAASEMKERVLSFIADLSKGVGKGKPNSFFSHIQQDTSLTEEEIVERSQKILTAILHNYTDLSISTIDKFVFRIVRTFAHDLQMAQAFEVEMDQDQLIQPTVSFLISRIGTNEELSKALVSFAISKADEGKSYNLERSLEEFSKHLFSEKSEKFIDSLSQVSINDCLEVKDELNAEMMAFENVLLEKRSEFLEFCKRHNLVAGDFTGKYFYNYFDNFKKRSSKTFFPSKSVKKNVDNNHWCKKEADEDKKSIIETNSAYLIQLFNQVQEHIGKEYKNYVFNKLLSKNIYSIAVLNELSKELDQFKEENNVKHISEFNNAIAEIIRKEPAPFIYERLGERYHHFLIDEFQDTSVMQWHNLLPLVHNSLSEGYQNLIVGDAKQSIYRWRGGEVEQFVQLPNEILQSEMLPNPEELKQSLWNNAEEKVLSDNWRSHKEIVNFNNAFFTKLKTVISPELQKIYTSNEQNPMGKDGGYIHIDLSPKSKDFFKAEVMQKIILQIHELRSLNYSLKNMAILCRTKKETFEAASSLNTAGINVLSDEALLLNASKEVHFVLSLLEFLHQPSEKVAQTFILTYLHQRENNEKIPIHNLLQLVGEGDIKSFYSYLESLGIRFVPQSLWELPIYDLVERLIQVFNLSSTDIYLQYFLDAVHKFSIKNSNDVSAFLEWWEKNNEKEAIVVAEDTEAVKVMTVHKSKGLEFPIVFIPFNWKIGKPADELWVDAKGKIKKMKVALLDNTKELEKSDYAELHKGESDKSLMDDLNVLYVAMTRPKEQLYIYTESFGSSDKFNSLSQLIAHYFKDTAAEFPVRIGQLLPKQNTDEEELDNGYHLSYTSLANWRKVIQLKNNSNQLWDVNLDRQQWGSLLHDALSKIHYLEDKEKVLNDLERNGLLTSELKSKLRSRLDDLLNDDEIKPFFSDEWEVKTEQEILLDSGDTYIPDRLLIKGDEVKVIDYKTGSSKRMESHKSQVDNYSNLLKMMGFRKISKYIIYTENIEKVVSW